MRLPGLLSRAHPHHQRAFAENAKKFKITSKFRYFALDFRIRVFPALEKKGSSRLFFSLLDSSSPISNAMHFNFHGRKIFDENCQDDVYSSGQVPMLGRKYGRSFYHPAFEPLSIRVVYDFSGPAVMTYFMNGRQFKPMKIGNAWGLRHFGIVIYGKNDLPHGTRPRKHYFELSPPQVHCCNNIDELPPPPQFSAYPYDEYSLDYSSKSRRSGKVSSRSNQDAFRAAMQHKNPDLQYAYALRQLYGKDSDADPEKGVQLLKDAAKEHHVLALYQLGICCWRGYGCQPDLKKAAQYFTKAANFDYPEAAAARLQLEMDLHGRPWFLSELYQKYLKKFPDRACGHDKLYFWHGTEFLSPKRLWGHLPMSEMLGAGSYLDYRLKANDPFSFLPYAIFLHKGKGDLDFKQGERYLERALKAKHFEAYPFWLLSRLYRNKLPEKEKIPQKMCLLHAGHPMFNFVYTLLCMPETERMKYLLESDGELRLRPQKEWKMKTPESDYLRAMEQCMWDSLFPDLCLFGLLSVDKEFKRRSIFELIHTAAKARYAPAQYLMGRFYYYSDLPEAYQQSGLSPQLTNAERFLTDAAKQEHVPAALLLCKVKLDSPFPKCEAILPLLEKLCAMKIPEAFYLKAEALLKMNRLPEALTAAQKAVDAGEYRGLLFLSLHDRKDDALRRSRQVKFIQTDRARRRMDPYDPFWDDPYGEYLKWTPSEKLNFEEKEHPFGPPIVKLHRSDPEEIPGRAAHKKGRAKGKSKIKFRSE